MSRSWCVGSLMLSSGRALVLACVALTTGACIGGLGRTTSASDSGEDPAECNSEQGLAMPLTVCSGSEPCNELGALEDDDVATSPSKIPTCATADESRPAVDDGPAKTAVGIDGTTRYVCEYRPPGTSASSKRPLVLWLHGAFGTADNVYNATSIRSKAESFDLSGDPARPGFILVSVQGRNIRWPTIDPRDGSHHDIYYRDLGTPSKNPDIANLDRIIDDLVTEGVVDRDAIYLMGWSNGGFFSQLYAIARHETETPGGNRVAAAAVYTAADPFHNTSDVQEPSCRLDPYPKSSVPIYLISRACDIIACSEEQAAKFRDDGKEITPGTIVDTWESDLQSRVGIKASRRIVDGSGVSVDSCQAPAFCLYALALVNHTRWPDGIDDKSGNDYELEMLAFLRDNG